jgi:hypothetical protein
MVCEIPPSQDHTPAASHGLNRLLLDDGRGRCATGSFAEGQAAKPASVHGIEE